MDKGQLKVQVLVQWDGLLVDESSWEDIASLQEICPELNWEDQVWFHGERNVTDVIVEEFVKNADEKSIRLRKRSIWNMDEGLYHVKLYEVVLIKQQQNN